MSRFEAPSSGWIRWGLLITISLHFAMAVTAADSSFAVSLTHTSTAVTREQAFALAEIYFGFDPTDPEPGPLFADSATVVDFDVSNHMYFADSVLTTRAWAIRSRVRDYSHYFQEPPKSPLIARSFTIYIDSATGCLIEIRSDTLHYNGMVGEFTREDSASSIHFIHQMLLPGVDDVLIDNSLPEAGLQSLFENSPLLLLTQIIVAYLVREVETDQGVENHIWIVFGYNAPAAKHGLTVYIFAFDTISGNGYARMCTAAKARRPPESKTKK